MNYRHAYHAGNFADVVKHVVLVALLLHLRKKDKPFAVIDSHAGRGLYDLAGTEAARTQEAADGIGRLVGLEAGEGALKTYLDIVARAGEGRYPGSPLIAAHLLRPQDRLIAIERHPQEFAGLRTALAQFARAKPVEADGYARLQALLPPQERRGLVLIDPPFEADDEFERAAGAFAQAHRRFATGQYLLWYPIKSRAAADAFAAEILTGGPRTALRVEIARKRPAEETRLSAAGLILVNPPFDFPDSFARFAPAIEQALGDAWIRLDWLRQEAA